MAEERLQKILVKAGYGSRRGCEEFIIDGRVSVNGKVAELGSKADPQIDRITVDGKPIAAAEEPVYIALNKPRGVLSDDDPENSRKTILDLVPVRAHLFPVGRLDYDSEGLILLTNDGELANKLTHPRYEHEKEYRVELAAVPDQEQLSIWRRGVVLEDGFRTAPAKVEIEGPPTSSTWVRITMHEGRKRQIREVGNRIGLPVRRIIRVRIGTLQLGKLKPREWRFLSHQEIASLKATTGEKTSPKPRVPRKPGTYRAKKMNPR